MWADKSSRAAALPTTRLSYFFSLQRPLFPLQASLFFFPRHARVFTHAHLHPSPAYTRRRTCVHAERPGGTSSNLLLLSFFLFSPDFYTLLMLGRDQNERRLRFRGFDAHGFPKDSKMCSRRVTLGIFKRRH